MPLINVNGMLIDGVEIPVPLGDVARPDLDMPVRGERRIVKIVDLPGLGLCPILWTSPYTFDDPDLKARCRHCAILLAKGPPALCQMATIPIEALEMETRETVVEW
jgi:hypothetical protein